MKFKVLIVDDEKMIREGMKNIIPWKELGIEEVFTAESGAVAMKYIRKEAPDIMITDISMTEMTGLTLIEKALVELPELRVLVLTGYDSFEYARECLRLHVQDFLLKPIDEDVLGACVAKQVEELQQLYLQNQGKSVMDRADDISDHLITDHYLCRLLSDQEKDDAVEYLNVNFSIEDDAPLAVIVLKNSHHEKTQIVEMQNRQGIIFNLAMSVFDAENKGLTFFCRQEDCLVIVAFLERCGSMGLDDVHNLYCLLQDELGIMPTVVVGKEVSGLRELYRSYQDACQLLKMKDVDSNHLIHNDSAREKYGLAKDVIAEMKREISENISDYTFVMHTYDCFAKALEAYQMSEIAIRKECFDMVCHILWCYASAGFGVSGSNLDQLIETLNNVNAEECTTICRQFVFKTIRKEENNVHEIVVKAQQFINRNLAENLSVANIAREMFLSPNYFSRLFKQMTGCGCNEYIVKKRMEKACALLKTTNYNVGSISAMVGYNDTNYFSMAFKKFTGFSPTKYRGNYSEEEDTQGTI